MIKKIYKFIQLVKKELQNIIFALLSSWLFALIILMIKETILAKNKTNYTQVKHLDEGITVDGYLELILKENLLTFLVLTISIAIILFCLTKLVYKKLLLFTLPSAFLIYGVLSIYNAIYNPPNVTPQRAYLAFLFIALSAVIIILCINYVKQQKIPLAEKDISLRTALIIVILAFVALSGMYIYLLRSRVTNYSAPGFDMGIFAQMLDNMTESKHSFAPMVTCERGEYLSHFAVHFSPILYLLVPFALIFNVLDVLVFAQILVVFSGVFPLFLICRQLKLSNAKSLILSLLYLLYPAMSSGSFYDFHENAFLAPLILWTLYFSHRRGWLNTIFMFVFAILTLMVKEDAAIYVAIIALFIFFSQKQRIKGIALFIFSVCYFFFALEMISLFGEEGNMLASRYSNVIGINEDFTSLITTFIANPAIYAFNIFSADKFIYAIIMFLPLAFLPIITRKPSRLLLIAPLLIINLIPDWEYQYDLGFQYHFGSGALLIYLAALNVADMSFAPMFVCEHEDGPKAEPTLAQITESADSTEANVIEADTTASDAVESDAVQISVEQSEENTEISKISTSEVKSEEPAAEAIIKTTQNDKKKLSSKLKFINNLTVIALIFSLFSSIFLLTYRLPGQTANVAALRTEKRQKEIQIIENALAKIDRSKSVLAAASQFVTPLYDVDELYAHNDSIAKDKLGSPIIKQFTEYVVIGAATGYNLKIINKYKLYRYKIIAQDKNLITVMQRTEKSPPVGPAEEK